MNASGIPFPSTKKREEGEKEEKEEEVKQEIEGGTISNEEKLKLQKQEEEILFKLENDESLENNSPQITSHSYNEVGDLSIGAPPTGSEDLEKSIDEILNETEDILSKNPNIEQNSFSLDD